MTNQPFERALELLRTRGPRFMTLGFDFLREHADAYVDRLVAAFEGERDDDELRCWLLELIAEARSPDALPVLAGALDAEDESLRFWAIRGLEMLDTAEARHELGRARANGWIA